MEKKESIKEIILVTDGESNMGGDPVAAARQARYQGITVNTVGIIDQKQQEEKPLEEIVNIANAGGGAYEYTYIEALPQTLQSLSHRTVTSTLQEVVNRQLQEILKADLTQLSPQARGKILNYIDTYSDEIEVYCCILLDCSGSMAPKIQAARHSILDMVESFKGRKGPVHLAVIGYPGEGATPSVVLQSFGDPPQQLERSLYRLKPGGGTPTALAIDRGVELIKTYLLQQQPSEAFPLVEGYY